MIAFAAAEPATAQKPGGILRFPILDSPASMFKQFEPMRMSERLRYLCETGSEEPVYGPPESTVLAEVSPGR